MICIVIYYYNQYCSSCGQAICLCLLEDTLSADLWSLPPWLHPYVFSGLICCHMWSLPPLPLHCKTLNSGLTCEVCHLCLHFKTLNSGLIYCHMYFLEGFATLTASSCWVVDMCFFQVLVQMCMCLFVKFVWLSYVVHLLFCYCCCWSALVHCLVSFNML